jgi:FkbM family methyltransferase
VVGAHNNGAVTFTQSTNPESSDIFRDWSAAYGIADQVDVPTIGVSSNSQVGGRVDLVKFDIEGAEVDVLKEAPASDLNGCGQFTAEFHDTRAPLTRRDVDDVCQRMRAARYAMVKLN